VSIDIINDGGYNMDDAEFVMADSHNTTNH